MNGPEHYREAERLLAEIDAHGYGAADVELAQAHATLALAAATALPTVKRYYGDDSDTDREWAGVTA